tara:strand:- start:24 stop:569 length:546 start_codon:yes stop_codon:yes gene_type:complete
MTINNIKKQFFLETKRFYIRPIKLKDANHNYLSWFTKKNKKYIEDAVDKKISINYLKNYIKKNINEKNTLFLAIFNKKNKHIGNIKFLKINFKSKISNLGIWIGNSRYLNKGVASETLGRCLQFLSDNNYIKIFELGVAADNKSAQKLYKKLGFKVNGKIKSKYYKTVIKMVLKKKNIFKK